MCEAVRGKKVARAALGCGLLLALLAFPAAADPDDWLDNPPAGGSANSRSFVAQPSVSAAQAAAHVRRTHGGRVLSVSPARRGNALGYRVRVLIDGGRVKTVYVDSGQSNLPAPSQRSSVRAIGDN